MIVTQAAILVSSLVLLAGPPSEQELGAGAARLLEMAEHRSPAGTAGASAAYRKLKQAAPDDPRIEYVAAVALVNRHRSKNALPLLERYLAPHPDDALAAQPCIWAQLHERNYKEALAGTVHLANVAATLPADDAQQTAEFLGTVYAYLELAHPDAVDEKIRSAEKIKVLGVLTDNLVTHFDQGRRQVLSRIAEIDAEREQQQQRLVEKIEQKQEATEAMLKEDAQTITVSKETLDTSGEELRDAQRKLVVIRQQLASLMSDRVKLVAQVTAVQAALLEQQQILADPPRTDRRPRPGTQIFPAQALAAAGLAQQLSISLAALNKQLFELDRKALALRAEGMELGGKSFEEAEAIANSRESLERAAKRTEALERRVKQLERKKPVVAARVLSARKRALATYLPFPYEAEKKRVLAWFAQP